MDNLSNKLGRVFVILTDEDKRLLRRSVLIVDNSYWPYENIRAAVDRTRKRIPGAEISVLMLEGRQGFRAEDFAGVEIIHPDQALRSGKHQLARQMLRLRRRNFTYIVLTSLDKTPIAAALLCMTGRVFLYNRWDQWYALRWRRLWEYLTFREGADKRNTRGINPFLRLLLFVPMVIAHLCVFVYLLVTAVFILFFKRPYYALKFRFAKENDTP